MSALQPPAAPAFEAVFPPRRFPGRLRVRISGAKARRCGVALPLGGLVSLGLLVLLGGCGEPEGGMIELSGPTMGTYYSVKVVRPPPGVTREGLQQGVDGVLQGVNRQISTYDPESELSRFNRNLSTEWVEVSPELLGVVAEGQRTSGLSEGAFDITVGPLVNLWGFGPDPRTDRVPADQAIEQARQRVGYQWLWRRAEPPALRKERPDLYLDLSALGEGYGADRVAEYLIGRGATDFMVAVAGAIRVQGHNVKGSPWAIAIEEPTPGKRAVQRIIQITGEGLSTSGDYRNYFEQDGKRYSHEIDPRTGRPIEHRLASVTLVSQSAMRADALATALMVLGEERGVALAEAQGLAALFIVRTDAGFREQSTRAFGRYLAQ